MSNVNMRAVVADVLRVFAVDLKEIVDSMVRCGLCQADGETVKLTVEQMAVLAEQWRTDEAQIAVSPFMVTYRAGRQGAWDKASKQVIRALMPISRNTRGIEKLVYPVMDLDRSIFEATERAMNADKNEILTIADKGVLAAAIASDKKTEALWTLTIATVKGVVFGNKKKAEKILRDAFVSGYADIDAAARKEADSLKAATIH